MTPATDIRSQIESTNQQFMAAFKRGDAAALAGLYTADALLLPPNAEIVRGSDSIRASWEAILKLGLAEVALETIDLQQHGDTAIEVGRARIMATGGSLADEGKYLVVWKNDGGTWKLHRDIWNSSRPAGS